MKYDLDDKKEFSLNPVIMLLNALIVGVLALMFFLSYRYITSDNPPAPPPRAIPVIAEVEEEDYMEEDNVGDMALSSEEADVPLEDEAPVIQTPPPVVTRAITPPPTTVSPS